MTLVKKSEWPSLISNSFLTDFFDGDKFFDSDLLRNRSLPAVNVRETDKNFEIELAAPGLNKKDFKVTAENGILTISSEKQEEKEQKEKDYTRREFSFSSFSRSFTMPENSNEDDIKANYEDGIFKLQIAKKVIGQPKAKKAIEVK
jgi:HSP20 family protein